MYHCTRTRHYCYYYYYFSFTFLQVWGISGLGDYPRVLLVGVTDLVCCVDVFCKKKSRNHLLGQGSSLHCLDSSLSPGHDFPPKAGGGLVQVLVLSCTPPPHVTGHSLQSFQSDQLPSTKLRVKSRRTNKQNTNIFEINHCKRNN